VYAFAMHFHISLAPGIRVLGILLALSPVEANFINIRIPLESRVQFISPAYQELTSVTASESTRAKFTPSGDGWYQLQIPLEGPKGEFSGLRGIRLQFEQDRRKSKVSFEARPDEEPSSFRSRLNGLEFRLSTKEWATGKIWNGRLNTFIRAKNYRINSSREGLTELVKKGMRRKIRIFNALYEDSE
jgi:hypothetical protein